jgi:hypothetical protein
MSMEFTYDNPPTTEQLQAPLRHFLLKKLGDRLEHVETHSYPDGDWRYAGFPKWNPHASFVTVEHIEERVNDMLVTIGVAEVGILQLANVETLRSELDFGRMLRFLYRIKEDSQ